MIKFLSYFLLIVLALSPHLVAQESSKQMEQADTLLVGLAGSAPFLMVDTSTKSFSGVAFEIWRDIAIEKGWNYKTMQFPSVPEALNALRAGNIDVLVGPVNITSERARTVNFSQPYYYSGQGIMSRIDERSIWDRISPFFNTNLLFAVLALLFVLFVVGLFVWIAEKKASPEQFPEDAPRGIANGMWLAIVTMSTTGYGDKAPITFWGRVLTGTWMVISMIFSASLVAGIASSFTLSGMGSNIITEANQLRDVRVVAPSYDVVRDFLTENHAIAIKTKSLDEAYQMLKDKKVDAIVFDRPQLLYLKQSKADGNIIVSKSYYEPAGYGFAFPNTEQNLIKELNIQMLELNELGKVKSIINEWLDDRD
jgi:polar amino acid transport system substrate-binding protein